MLEPEKSVFRRFTIKSDQKMLSSFEEITMQMEDGKLFLLMKIQSETSSSGFLDSENVLKRPSKRSLKEHQWYESCMSMDLLFLFIIEIHQSSNIKAMDLCSWKKLKELQEKNMVRINLLSFQELEPDITTES